MATLKRNFLANLLSSGWIALLTLVTTPVQVNLLGVEAYAIIAVIATLQLMIGVFDLGLSSTLTRQIAVDHSPGRHRSASLVRTAITIYWCMAAFIGFALYLAAEPIAQVWLNPDNSSSLPVGQALKVIAVFLALRWPVAVYAGILAGVQRMDVLNLAKSGFASLRLLGGLGVILVTRDLSAFLYWTLLSALLEVIAHALLCRHILPNLDWRPGFSMVALRSVWAFSLSMNALAILSVLLTQVDRVLISRMLSLEALGFYLLAWQIASSISVILAALSSALMPSLAAAHGAGEGETLLRRYYAATRVLLFLTGTFLLALLFFGELLLRVWVDAEAAANAWRPLAFVAAGLWLSSACSAAYQSAVASGRADLILKISAASVVPYLVVLYSLISVWGITGAGLACFLLHLGYALSVVPMVHRVVLGIPVWSWYRDVVLPFPIIGLLTFGSARLLTGAVGLSDGVSLLAVVSAAAVYLIVGHLYAGADFRAEVRVILRHLSDRWGMAW